ncbi:enoyl-CoA hydratase-related protein [Burkholderia vietnamiensis]|nr:enoyl-CoA hydratase-related protein [Burkholderia vietnamiensis]MBH9645863.1 enoyl-CoA hydratase/isomerase family protein [Burkholderia vietnamiensis]MDN7551313.1 enoyl-CoA hydratase-related protein [Burkholderia vietnamiensis]MDN8073736.1 enoyl-CoA hydratase-related protein [Burkholderia vietnamiensis]HDR8982678.1 enoyl-CoA hydratase/isomerase family protein [Burkholderia vietnamiensis]HDR9000927.1 enoyl-CoA hydratase/isomerase family protein [Burkholderia vietnamiensis]
MTADRQSSVVLSQEGRVRVMTFTSAPKANPLTPELQRDLLSALDEAAADSSVGAVVLTGSGRTFCVGADLSAMDRHAPPGSADSVGNRTADMMAELTNPLVLKMRQLPVPVVCAINGAAAGAGVGLALSGDFTLAAQSSFFLFPFMPNLGIVPDMGSSWYLTRRLGPMRASAVMLLGDRVNAVMAAEWGLIHRSIPDDLLLSEAVALAQRLARLPAHAVGEIRAIVDLALEQPLETQLEYEAARQRELIDRPTFDEGARAFMEKRAPVFPHRGED